MLSIDAPYMLTRLVQRMIPPFSLVPLALDSGTIKLGTLKRVWYEPTGRRLLCRSFLGNKLFRRMKQVGVPRYISGWFASASPSAPPARPRAHYANTELRYVHSRCLRWHQHAVLGSAAPDTIYGKMPKRAVTEGRQRWPH